MFAGKVHGTARCRLLSYLLPLYHEGYHCILRCPSLQKKFQTIIQRPLLVNRTKDQSENCQVEAQLNLEVWNSKPCFEEVQSKIKKQKQELDDVISNDNTEFDLEMLQLWSNYLIQNLSISACIRESTKINNTTRKSRQYSMAAIPVVDATRHLLYTALYHYRNGTYSTAISLLQEAKLKLQHPHLMYPWTVSAETYRTAGGEHKLYTHLMKEIVAWPVELRTKVTIPELTLEHQVAANHSTNLLAVPPLVFTNFLCFLCYYHAELIQEAQSVIQELSSLVQYDIEDHIYISYRALSWQMLGICQEMSCDHLGAYQSYYNAFIQKFSKLHFASLVRIAVILNKHVTGGQFKLDSSPRLKCQ